MEEKKFTKREKRIMLVAGIILIVVVAKLKDDVWKAGVHYNKLADKLCSGGLWMATDIGPKRFKLVRVVKNPIIVD